MSAITYTIQSQGLSGASAALSQIVVGLEYFDPTHFYGNTAWFVLTADHPTAQWTFDPGAATTGTLFYQGVYVGTNGSSTAFGPSPATGENILVGSGVPAVHTVTIVPMQIDWNCVDTADITVAGKTLRFTAAADATVYLPVAAEQYDYSILYTLKTGDTYAVQASGTTLPILMLPPVPPLSTVTFEVPAGDFTNLPIDRVTLTVTAPGKPLQTLTFTPTTTKQTVSLFQTQCGAQWSLLYDYSYVVTYTSQPQAYQAQPATAQSAVNVVLTEMGVRNFLIDGDLPPLIPQIYLSYQNRTANIQIPLPATLFVVNGDYTPSGAFPYMITYTVSGQAIGATAPQSGSYIQSFADMAVPYVHIVGNPFTLKTVTFTAQDLDKSTTIQISPQARETGNLGLPDAAQWAIDGTVPIQPAVLSKRNNSAKICFAAVDPTSAAVFYPGNLITKEKTYVYKAPIDEKTEIVLTATALPNTITIDPTQVDWATVANVTLQIWSLNDPDTKSAFQFLPTSGYNYQTYQGSLSGGVTVYAYQAVYAQRDGNTRNASATGLLFTTLNLPQNGN